MPTLTALGPGRLALLGAIAVLSPTAFIMYGVDKMAARRGRRRTPEATLHLVAVAGGWPGAFIARHVFRHKTSKQPFRTVFWCTVVVNLVVFAWLWVKLTA